MSTVTQSSHRPPMAWRGLPERVETAPITHHRQCVATCFPDGGHHLLTVPECLAVSLAGRRGALRPGECRGAAPHRAFRHHYTAGMIGLRSRRDGGAGVSAVMSVAVPLQARLRA
jgi:hypothetical protein